MSKDSCVTTTSKISPLQRCDFADNNNSTNDNFLSSISLPRASISGTSSHARSPKINPDDTFQDNQPKDRCIILNTQSKQSLATLPRKHPDPVSIQRCYPDQGTNMVATHGVNTEGPTSACNKITDIKEVHNEQDVNLEESHPTRNWDHAKEEFCKDQELASNHLSFANTASDYEKRLSELQLQLKEIRALLETDKAQMKHLEMQTSPCHIPKEIDVLFDSKMCSGEGVCSSHQDFSSTIESALPSSHLSESSQCKRVIPSYILRHGNQSHLSFSPNSSFDYDDGSFLNEPFMRHVRKPVQLLHPRKHFQEFSTK
jgi:hypothetical protein